MSGDVHIPSPEHRRHSCELGGSEFRAKGCTCEFGCPQCGYSLASMGNCPAWSPCPVGRETKAGCPLHAPTHDRERQESR